MPTKSGAVDSGDSYLLFERSSALDVAAFVVVGTDLSPGDAIPSDGDPRIDRALAGFLFTCGPDHIRHPEPVEGSGGVVYPLHGSLAGTPVARTQMSADGIRCTAITEVDLACGGRAAVERCWRVEEDGRGVMLEDRVVNVGSSAFAPMMMYHMNIAGRLLGGETRIESPSLDGGSLGWRFGEGDSAHFCRPAVAGDDGWSQATLSTLPGLEDRCLHVRFRADTLPFLQMWRCQRGGANVISIEPASHRLAQRAELSASGELSLLEPGQWREFALAFHVT